MTRQEIRSTPMAIDHDTECSGTKNYVANLPIQMSSSEKSTRRRIDKHDSETSNVCIQTTDDQYTLR
jgi:hypothetical protein